MVNSRRARTGALGRPIVKPEIEPMAKKLSLAKCAARSLS
jgi:hypothetical protein